MTVNYSLLQLVLFFFIYSFIGWLLETVVLTIRDKKFVNRGFLLGPCCPIYGIGVVSILVFLTPLADNPFLIFFGAMILTSILELITGFVLSKVFHQKWWDYSDKTLNIGGYICLRNSLFWGVACLFVIYVVQPPLGYIVSFLDNGFGLAIIIFLLIILAIDLMVTLSSLLKIKHKISLLEEIGKNIKISSDMIGTNITDSAKNVLKFNAEKRQEVEVLMKKYRLVQNRQIFGLERLQKAFPALRRIKKLLPKSPKNTAKKNNVKTTTK